MEGAVTAVFVDDGSSFDSTGDEFRCWNVAAGDDDGEYVGKPTECSSFEAAMELAWKLAETYDGVEVVTC